MRPYNNGNEGEKKTPKKLALEYETEKMSGCW